jgi:hypothetical protein
MKNEDIDAVQVWRDFGDRLAPRLNFSVTDRAVYSHLLRRSRLEGKLRIRFSPSWLGPRIRLSARTARESVRRLIVWGRVALSRTQLPGPSCRLCPAAAGSPGCACCPDRSPGLSPTFRRK